MNIDTLRQSLTLHFLLTYVISFVVLGGYKYLLEKNHLKKHMSIVRLLLAFFFLASYLYGINLVLNTGSGMEQEIIKVTQNSPGTNELLKNHCRSAWVKEITGKANNLADLSPCIILTAAISKEQQELADGKTTLPTSLMSILIAFLSAFQGGLCATFMYAWATTVPETTDSHN
ncbi:hypothetical protein [Rugamonas apoptosis]|uniref:Uncharacterized protein n=1 Tax=Rugamonas apoptosis TaxID=2758570 RepID=A0A7W2F753_9BURK|nr:hypothetical protein [Rugamonas apoptosis]MBA5686330.1 hypothetical protein [Rugamonas apoptosis]